MRHAPCPRKSQPYKKTPSEAQVAAGAPGSATICARSARGWRDELLFPDLRITFDNIRRPDPQHCLDLFLNLGEQCRIVLQVHLRVLTALSYSLRPVAIPRTGLVDDARFGSNVQDQGGMADPLGIHDVELSLLERRSDLVLHNLHSHM